MDKVSIITVTYNTESFLERTIQSVLNQTYPNIEYIIIDGGSTDGTIDIIKKYDDKLFYWISEPDKGIYDAMNKGMKIASGIWISFMNSGDYFVNSNILVNVFNNVIPNHISVLYGNTILRYVKTDEKVNAKSLSYFKKGMPFCHQSSFIRNGQLPAFDTKFKIAADYNLFFSLYESKGSVPFLYLPIYIAYYDACSGVSANVPDTYKEYLVIRKSSFYKLKYILFLSFYTIGKYVKKRMRKKNLF